MGEFFGNVLGILWEFNGNSIGILWGCMVGGFWMCGSWFWVIWFNDSNKEKRSLEGRSWRSLALKNSEKSCFEISLCKTYGRQTVCYCNECCCCQLSDVKTEKCKRFYQVSRFNEHFFKSSEEDRVNHRKRMNYLFTSHWIVLMAAFPTGILEDYSRNSWGILERFLRNSWNIL